MRSRRARSVEDPRKHVFPPLPHRTFAAALRVLRKFHFSLSRSTYVKVLVCFLLCVSTLCRSGLGRPPGSINRDAGALVTKNSRFKKKKEKNVLWKSLVRKEAVASMSHLINKTFVYILASSTSYFFFNSLHVCASLLP